MAFVGRRRELGRLAGHLDHVREGGADQRGRAVLLRGRRRVGKSRLVERFLEQAQVPSVFFQAARGNPANLERERFARTVASSTLPQARLAVGNAPASWLAAWLLLADLLPAEQPSIVVLDEAPWLLAGEAGADGQLQVAWDTALSRKPVLLLLLGSDVAVMERLSDYDQPFHQRGSEMVLLPLDPAAVGELTGTTGAAALEAALVTGGLPLVCQEWRPGWSRQRFLAEALADPTSALIVSGERILAAEFPVAAAARSVLSVIGGRGERSFTAIANAAGGGAGPALNASVLSGALSALIAKRVVAVDTPLSTRAAERDKRYRVADPFLRFWLTFVEPALPAIERGRGDLALRRVDEGWPSWVGRAVEPLVRDALGRLLPDDISPDVAAVGGWWPRTHRPELDLIGADRSPVADRVLFVGSTKWHQRRPFGVDDLAALTRDAIAVPGADGATPLVAVSRTGFASGLDGAGGLSRRWDAEDLLDAWRTTGTADASR